LLSIKSTIIGQPDAKLPVWKPSVIPESSTIGDIMALWAERTFGQVYRSSQLPSGARCYVDCEKGKCLDRDHVLRKIKRKLPLVDGRLSLFIAWPLPESRMVLDDRKGSQLVKRSIGEVHALAKIGALVPQEPQRKKKGFFCFMHFHGECTDPDCPYPHYRL